MTSFPFEKLRPLYGFLDPAGPKRRTEALKHVAARSALILAGADDLGRVFCVHAWAARTSTDALIEKILDVCERYRPKVLGCEEDALAGFLTDAVYRDARLRGRVLPLLGVKQPRNLEKDYRIRTTLQPLIANGRLFLLSGDPGMLELRAEIATFPMNHRKDMVDALASLVRLMPLRASRGGRDEEREAYLRYLRESGVPPTQIEAAAAQWRREVVASDRGR